MFLQKEKKKKKTQKKVHRCPSSIELDLMTLSFELYMCLNMLLSFNKTELKPLTLLPLNVR